MFLLRLIALGSQLPSQSVNHWPCKPDIRLQHSAARQGVLFESNPGSTDSDSAMHGLANVSYTLGTGSCASTCGICSKIAACRTRGLASTKPLTEPVMEVQR